MKSRCILLVALAVGTVLRAAGAEAAPVATDASPEARALLRLLGDISGRYTLTGQHNFPATRDRNSQFAAQYTGKDPVIFGSDWGHARAGDTDSYLARPDIVKEAIRQHQRGAIVALCWHAVPPTADEPITFRAKPGADPRALASVQGRLPDDQFRDVLTPGTALHERWCAQVDAVAAYLRQLRDAHVPVLWRPYHEMNGDWFWWGGRPGPEGGTAALYRQMFERFNKVHHLNNLVWVWSMDRPSKPGREFEAYFPGAQYMDVLALDVYGSDFKQEYYDGLLRLAGDKPIALAEVGSPPSPEVLEKQPRWAYYMIWAGMVRNTPRMLYSTLGVDPRILGLADPAYAEVTRAYRKACGLEPVAPDTRPADFSGTWTLNEERSMFGPMGPAMATVRYDLSQGGGRLKVRATRVLEYADDEVSEVTLTLDGAEVRSEAMGSPRVTHARLSNSGDALLLDSTITPLWLPSGSTLSIQERWSLADGGRTLVIDATSTSPRGTVSTHMVYDRR